MNNNGGHFFARDPKGFEKYLVKVETGKGSISGAAMLPHELVAQIIVLEGTDRSFARRKEGKNLTNFSTITAVVQAREALAETKARVIEAQWKTLIESLREAGTLIIVLQFAMSLGLWVTLTTSTIIIMCLLSLLRSLSLWFSPPLQNLPSTQILSPFPLNLSMFRSISSNLSENKLLLWTTLIGVQIRTSGLFSLTCSCPLQ